jgi:HK97 family phage portal protein
VSLLDYFKPKAAIPLNDGFVQQFPTTNTSSSLPVDPDIALTIGTVYACVRVLAETIASLPIRVYRSTANGRESVPTHSLNNVLGLTANAEQTAMELREFQMSSLGLRGNAYSLVRRSNRGGIGAIYPLKPKYMQITRDSASRLVFDYTEPNNSGVYSASQIWRIAALGSDGVTGLSPVALAKDSMALALATEKSAARVFSNGNQTSTILKFDKVLTEEQIERLRNQFSDNYAGYKNAHKPLILESGMDAVPIGMNSDEAQFLQSRKFQIAEIARWYRVPLHMLNELDRATFSNIEHQSIEFVMHTIRPWLVRIEQTISRDLLTESDRAEGLYVAHSVEGLLRGDTKSRYEAYGKGIQDGWMNRNEVRKLENLNPVDGLEEYLVPLNMGKASDVADLAGAENRVLLKEAKARSLESFAEWLPGFYQRHEKKIGDRLGCDAKGYAATRMERMSEHSEPLDAVLDAVIHTRKDIEALL